jgi:hypothetical protein
MSATDTILATLERIIILEGGVAEPKGEHALSALLPERIADAMEMPSEVDFTTRAGLLGARFVSYNSDVLKRFESLFERRGALSAVRITYDGYMKKSGFEQVILDRFAFPDGVLRVGDARAAETAYLACTVAYTAESEEKRHGKLSFVVNMMTGAVPAEIGDALLWETDRVPLRTTSPSRVLSSEALERIVADFSSRKIDEEIAPWRERLERRMHGDEERLCAYYSAIASDIERKIQRRGLTGEDRSREEARIAATRQELERKTTESRARYAMEVTASLHSALLVLLPTVHIRCELAKKRRVREIVVVWNPFIKTVEALRCARGGEPLRRIFLDDDDALICAACHGKG